MDFLDIIGKVIEFSEKGEEYSDEIKAFRATLESLQLTVQNIEPEDMPTHLSGMLSDNLQEAKELLNKAGNQNSTWLTNIRNMLPGSQLQKIKEKNQQLVHIITLINLHLNSNVKGAKRGLDTSSTANYDDEEPTKLKRMHTYSTSSTTPKNASMQKKSQSDTKFDLLGPTLEANGDEESALEGPTQADGDGEEYTGGDEGHAFRLRVLYDERLGKALKGCKDFVPIIEKTWEGSNNAEYIFQRVNYAYLPMEDVKRLSRDHAVINAIRGVATNGKEEDYTVTATVPDDDKLYGATIQDDAEEEKTNGNVGGDGVKFVLKDLSLNGTHYLKSDKLLNFPPGGMKINGEFKLLKKNEEAVLENGDIIGLIMQKPYCKDLIFGFQLLTE